MRQSYTSNSLIVQSFKMLSSNLKFVQVETASKFYTFPTTANEFGFLQEQQINYVNHILVSGF